MDSDILKAIEDKCNIIGVTPLELYMRQNGLCYLVMKGGEVYCTDGEDEYRTEDLSNPTTECSRCMVKFFKSKIDNYGI